LTTLFNYLLISENPTFTLKPLIEERVGIYQLGLDLPLLLAKQRYSKSFDAMVTFL
jgi:hypothetical protein